MLAEAVGRQLRDALEREARRLARGRSISARGCSTGIAATSDRTRGATGRMDAMAVC